MKRSSRAASTLTSIASQNSQMAFGYGGHSCLGQYLARIEMIAFWDALLPRLDADEPERVARFAAARLGGGLKSLPIRHTMR